MRNILAWGSSVRLLVTGGAGFIGSNFVRRAFDGTFKDFRSVIVLDKLTYSGVLANLSGLKDEAGFEFAQGDICDSRLVAELVESVDMVVNFAAESHVDRSIENASEFVKTNVLGVQVLLDAIKNGSKSKRFLQVSTDEVYGSIDSGSWDEEFPLKPNSPYSASKAGGEFLARSYGVTHGMDIVTTRCSNNYGPFHFPEKMIPLFITNLIQGKQVPVYGDGTNVRDWLHVDDHCQGIYLALMNGKPNEVYNIGGGTELSNLELTHLILDALEADKSSIEYVQDRKGHDQRYSVNCAKIQKELGYQPQVKFKDGLASTIDWYRKNQDWWGPLKKRSEIA
jgi:dTDP-glucose 4,6-dehydratase